MRRAVLVATVIAVAAVTGGAAHAAAAELPPPVPHGALRIAGTPRDGATVSASGLRWRPGRLPHGDRLLSFAVATTWEASTLRPSCRRTKSCCSSPSRRMRMGSSVARTSCIRALPRSRAFSSRPFSAWCFASR